MLITHEFTIFLSPHKCRPLFCVDKEEDTSPKKGKFHFKALYFMTEEMYAPLSWVMSKQPRDNAFLKASFYTLIDNVTD